MFRRPACLIMLLLSLTVSGQKISVRIYSHTKPSTFVFTPQACAYMLLTAGGDIITLKPGDPVIFSRHQESLVFKVPGLRTMVADTVTIVPEGNMDVFTVRQPANSEPPRNLSGRLKVYIYSGSVMILNITDIESYLPGVVKAEAGTGGPSEYLRAQAVIARTYVYRHLQRHTLDGYNLCDDVHCQAYSGLVSALSVREACAGTAGEVLADADSVLIISAFHANCGGETASSADTWVAAEPYLVSVTDTFCIHYKPVTWEKKIPAADWNRFLMSKGIEYNEDSLFAPATSLKPERVHDYIIMGRHVPSADIRNYFNLKSTFFSFRKEADTLVITGRGYGHGVGLCQDGARAMAMKGMTYKDITRFYYPGTSVINIKMHAYRQCRETYLNIFVI